MDVYYKIAKEDINGKTFITIKINGETDETAYNTVDYEDVEKMKRLARLMIDYR